MKKETFLTRAATLLFAALLAHHTSWAQNSVSTITTSENITKSSIVYAGEVVVDGVTMIHYLYSGNMSRNEVVINNLLNGLQGMSDSGFADLLNGLQADEEASGLTLCSDVELAAAINENWSSAQYVGTQYYTGTTVTSETSSNLYDIDEGFKAALEALAVARTADIDEPLDAGKSILTHIDSRTVTDVWYSMEGSDVIRHYDTNVIYDSEATTVIYTKVELELPMTSTPLTLEAVTSGEITFILTLGYEVDPSVMTPIEYQKNGGEWTVYTWNEVIEVAAGEKVAFRGNNAKYFGNGTPNFDSHILSTANVYVYGNIMSLISSTDFATLTTLTGKDTFSHLFAIPAANPWEVTPNTTILNHPTKDLVLPAMTLTNMCYQYMFAGCQGLTRAPELPATEMTVACYASMFEGCTGLIKAPAILPCTYMTPYSVDESDPLHWEECGSIDCYMEMFKGCTSLKEAPELPATHLEHGVYQYMFSGCTSLQKAPVLPAAQVADFAYSHMFEGCTSLNYVKCLATEFLTNPDFESFEEDDVEDWLKGVSLTGTFVKADGMTSWQTGDSGIPEGWTVVDMTKTVPLNSDGEGNYWATYYNDVAGYTADENTTVYTAKVSDDQKKVLLTEVVDKTIPAGNAVVLKSTTENVTMTYVDDTSGTLADNDLQGSAIEISTPANTYMLVKGSRGVGFYHWMGDNIPAGRGYLTFNGASETRSFLSISQDHATAIESVERIIEESGVIYDLTGRRLTTVARQGIYVKNGKKIIVK